MLIDKLPRTTVDISGNEAYLRRITTDRSGNRVVETIPVSSIPHLRRPTLDPRLRWALSCFATGVVIGLLWFALENM